ncbi:MAG: hypothetical protein EOO73_11640 [Myxococcales bacterium]|nr:MAG: hypothetical protein EOO73_11640 [Myxococcales bacterium]
MTESTLYCRDFDDERAYDEDWSNVYADPNQPALLSTASPGSRDGSRYLTFPTPELASEDRVFHQLQYVASSGSGLSMRFDARVTDFDSRLGDLTLVSIYAGADQSWKLGLDLIQGWIQISESHYEREGNPGSFEAHEAVRPDLEEWKTMELTLVERGSAWEVSLALEGKRVIGPVPVSPVQAPTVVKTTIGVDTLHGPARPMSISYDNIAFSTLDAPPAD